MRTAIYCRVSTPGQKNTTSLPEQERICREHVAGLGWPVSEPHVYREVEGGQDLYRPQMDRLWDAIIRHEINAIVIDVLDRLSRDEGDQGAFYHHCDRYGVQVEIASQDIDESENGRNLRTLAGISARMERADIRRRTQRGRKARAASGKLFPASFPLYGYLFAPDTGKGLRAGYIVDPETGWVVVLIYERVADGVPIRTLAKQLEAEGIPTPGQVLAARGQLPKGKTVSGYWRHGSILRILHHPAYVGQHSAYRWQTSSVKTRPVDTGVTRKVRKMSERPIDDPARVTLPADVCPALITPELAARVQARLTASKAASAGRNPDPLATLWRGMAICGHCGGRLHTGQSSDGDGRRYKCLNVRADADGRRLRCPGGAFTLAASVLDPAGWADVLAWLSDARNVARLLKDWQDERAHSEHSVASRLDAADAQLLVLRSKMTALADAISETTARESRQVLQEKLDQLAGQLARETGKRERLLTEAADATAYAEAARDIAVWARVVAREAAGFTREEKRDTLRALGAQVTVWRADYVHPDGWPQRYKIVLRFTGFSAGGQAMILPPRTQQAPGDAFVTPAS